MAEKETHCSFKVSKLLEEKGFDGECHSYYYPCHYPDGSIQYHKYEKTESRENKFYCDIYSLENLPKDHYLAPTHQMAMAWLRKTYGIDIIIEISDPSVKDRKYYCIIYDGNNNSYILDLFNSWEDAVDAALIYVLENLI